MAHLVAATALILVPRTNGQTEYVYGGRPVPGDIDPDTLVRLLAEGQVVDVGHPVGGLQNDYPDLVVGAQAVTARKAAALAKAQVKANAETAAAAAADATPATVDRKVAEQAAKQV